MQRRQLARGPSARRGASPLSPCRSYGELNLHLSPFVLDGLGQGVSEARRLAKGCHEPLRTSDCVDASRGCADAQNQRPLLEARRKAQETNVGRKGLLEVTKHLRPG